MGEEDANFRVSNINHTQMSKESFSLAEMNQELYRPANYRRAVEYKESRSYLKKENGHYVTPQPCLEIT